MEPANPVIPHAVLARLPVFPLPGCVLLPGGLLPLHIFEPRYRAMTRDCLAADKLFAISRLLPPVTSDAGDSAVANRACVGEIIASEQLPDGRFMLLLRGIARVELTEELPSSRPYRTFASRLVDDTFCASDREELLRGVNQMRNLCDQLSWYIPSGGEQLRELSRCHEAPGLCADAIASAILIEACDRQAMLDLVCPLERVERVSAHMAKWLCEVAGGSQTVN